MERAPSWIRTSGLPLRRGTLYPAELSGNEARMKIASRWPVARGPDVLSARSLANRRLKRAAGRHQRTGSSVSGGTAELLHEAETDVSVASEIAARSPFQLFWRRLKKDKVALVALGIVGLMIFMAIFAPLIVKVLGLPDPHTPNDNLLDDFGQPTGPTSAHL